MLISARARDASFIFIFSVMLFTLGLSHQEIIGFEARFYLFALEMWRHGVSWFPTTYQEPYPDYPVTGTLLIYGAAKLFGVLNKFTAVLPSALASAVTVTVTYLMGAEQNRRSGWYSAGFLWMTVAFIAGARTLSLDQLITMITIVCLYRVKSQDRPYGEIIFWLALGFFVRGPIGLIMPTAVLCVYYLVHQNYRLFFRISSLAVALLVLCSVLLAGMAYHVGGWHFVSDVLRMEAAGRMQDAHRAPPIYFYFIEGLGGYALTFPLALFILLGLRGNAILQNKYVWVLIGWMAIILVGMSIPSDKKIRYILPMAPAAALFCGYFMVAPHLSNYLRYLRRGVKGLCVILPMICLIGLAVLHHHAIVLNYALLTSIFVTAQVAIVLAYRYEMAIFFLAAFVFVVSYILVVEPINLAQNRTRDFVQRIEVSREQSHALLVFYREGLDGLIIKYVVDMPRKEKPLIVLTQQDLKQLRQPVFVIAKKQYAAEFSPALFTKVAQGSIGHVEVDVWASKVAVHRAGVS